MSETSEDAPVKLYYDCLSVARRTSQKIHHVNEHDKDALVHHLIKTNEYTRVIVVIKTKREADVLAEFLQGHEIKALCLHSNVSAKEQKSALDSYTKNETDVLIMTDMILQAQTFESIEHMISYNIPLEPSFYYERLSALEEKGEGIALVSEEEEHLMYAIEVAMKVEIVQVELTDFKASKKPEAKEKAKKDKSKKPRHKKNKSKKQTKKKEEE
ncbi:DEAD/DEAH box helicase [Sulfurimonas sp. MAG313]|nr:DEAD/DEAH box helicase [Sulfurimonas sp. MAG313]MDF1880731.1 DEAD/DEAH box helicase [Sulfurimonas sp. MAG313]